MCVLIVYVFFFQAEDGIRDLVRSRGLGDVYKRQELTIALPALMKLVVAPVVGAEFERLTEQYIANLICLLYTSDAADERSSVDLGGRRIIKKKNHYILDSLEIVSYT